MHQAQSLAANIALNIMLKLQVYLPHLLAIMR
jgi:hypothetical protein